MRVPKSSRRYARTLIGFFVFSSFASFHSSSSSAFIFHLLLPFAHCCLLCDLSSLLSQHFHPECSSHHHLSPLACVLPHFLNEDVRRTTLVLDCLPLILTLVFPPCRAPSSPSQSSPRPFILAPFMLRFQTSAGAHSIANTSLIALTKHARAHIRYTNSRP